MWIAAWAFPQGFLALPFVSVLALPIVIAGVVICGWGVISFRRAHTTLNPRTPGSASALVVRGVYRVSRNPMYLGFLLLLIGWAVFLHNLLVFVAPIVFIAYMNRFQIRPEEQALSALFGHEYRAYADNVRRWL